MRARRPAAVAVLALLVALLVPSTPAHTGTPSAWLTAAVQDAVPAARPAARPHLDAGVLLDGLAPGPTWSAPAQQQPTPAASKTLARSTATGAVLARGPPQA